MLPATTLGNLAAIAQTNLKRMLAYSGIAQLGFMLLGFVPTVVAGNTVSAGNGYGSSLFYVLTYVLTTMGTFGLIMVLSLFGAFYYLRVVKVMYFDEPADATPVQGGGEARALLSANALAVLVLGILPGGLMALCARVIVQSLAG